MNSLLFSRSVIPYHRDNSLLPTYYQHIGVYAFRKPTLMKFTRWPVTSLEAIEKIECLRFLEMGISLKMVITNFEGVAIDTPHDLDTAMRYYDNIRH
jgi:CMP-2-keto-3-deoxyoctulosonic acid synthetase